MRRTITAALTALLACGLLAAAGTAQNDRRKSTVDDEAQNRARTEKAFRDWQAGVAPITDLLADDLRWTIAGRSKASRTYESKERFLAEVMRPFGARFSPEPGKSFRPAAVRGVYADGDTVVVHWDGEGTRRDGKPYRNSYAWFLKFRGGKVVEATAFYDSIAFDELWDGVAPAQ